jgi:hypothetical protein
MRASIIAIECPTRISASVEVIDQDFFFPDFLPFLI